MDCLKGRSSLQSGKQGPWAILQTHPENREYFVILTRMQPLEVLLVDINLLQFTAHNDIWGDVRIQCVRESLVPNRKTDRTLIFRARKMHPFCCGIKRGWANCKWFFKAYNKTSSPIHGGGGNWYFTSVFFMNYLKNREKCVISLEPHPTVLQSILLRNK